MLSLLARSFLEEPPKRPFEPEEMQKMKKMRSLVALLLLAALAAGGLTAQTHRTGGAQGRGAARRGPAQGATVRSALRPDARLTGLYRLDLASSDDPRAAATRRGAATDAFGNQTADTEQLVARLTSPDQLALERRGRIVSIASTRAPRITFEADGEDHTERAADGHTVRTRASLTENTLLVTSTGSADRDDDYSVSFDSLDDGRRLRVTRRIYGSRIGDSIVVRSIYNKISQTARFDIYRPQGQQTAAQARTAPPAPQTGSRRGTTRSSPPTIIRREPAPRVQQPPATAGAAGSNEVYPLVIQGGMRLVATLNSDLSTATAREGDPVTLTVREPGAYAGAIIQGRLARVSRGGRISGRAEMAFEFEQIRLPDGRTAAFNGTVEDVRAGGGDDVRVNNEGGNVQESDSQGNRTTQRAAIGAAVGAIIGAIAGGGKGAAIGAAVGAGAGVGSVYAQGRDDLELRSGTELIIRTARGQ